MRNFWKNFDYYMFYHRTFLNLFIHFCTSLLQIYFAVGFWHTRSLYFLFAIPLVPFVTDGIGHLIEGNFIQVLTASRMRGTTNSSGVDGLTNFIYRLIGLPIWFYRKLLS